MSAINQLKDIFSKGNSLIRLIYINIAVYIVLQLMFIIFRLFNNDFDLISCLALPADFAGILHHPWTIVSYMFLHEQLFHILFNMLALYWFGQLFLMFFSQKQLVSLYLTGGFAGAIFYVAAYNIFPFFQPVLNQSLLMGASGSIMAIIVASAMQSPNMAMRVIFIGEVKLKYIAAFAVLTSIFGITSNNAGGEIAHLGGALTAYIFIVSLRQGTDITKGLNKIIDAVYDLFRPRKLKVSSTKKPGNQKMSDAEFNVYKARKMEEIDKILDKIKTSGYESLSADEKKKLFEQGKK